MYNKFFNSYIEGTDKLVTALLNDHRHQDFDLDANIVTEFRFLDIWLPRQVGKTTYLRQLANTLSLSHPTKKSNVTFIDGINDGHHDIQLNKSVNSFSFSFSDQDLIDLNLFRGSSIDIILFDEMKTLAVRRIIESDELKPIISLSPNFAAISLHTV